MRLSSFGQKERLVLFVSNTLAYAYLTHGFALSFFPLAVPPVLLFQHHNEDTSLDMPSYLSVVSFLCVGLLAIFVPVARVRCNVANLAIVAWLVGSNLVHGINALIWANNVDIRAPVWCDIVTKLLLGASVALPGACICISRRLELASSSRPILNDPKSQTRRILLEFLLCYIIPLMYMALHLVTQDHRFDLIKDYGCSASIHPSSLGLALMWLPPLLLCFASFILSGLAVHHAFRMPVTTFAVHIASRSPLTSSIFVRRITVTMVTSGILFIVTLFSVFSVSTFLPWTSWASVHASMSVVEIVQSQDDIKGIQLAWWGIPVVSFVYIILSFTIGEESRDAFKWIHSHISRIPRWHPRRLMILPTYVKKAASRTPPMCDHEPLRTPETVDLKSGWDDMLDAEPRKMKTWLPERKSPNSLRTITPTHSRVTTPSPTTPTTCGHDDEAFIKSTLDYLGSPAAKSLGITSPAIPALLKPPPPIHISPRKAKLDTKVSSALTLHSSHDAPPSPRCVPTDVESVISSVFDASWPQPPPSPPQLAGITHKNRHHPQSPRCGSPAGSDDLDPGVSLLSPTDAPLGGERSYPFQGSGVSSVPAVPDLSRTKSYKRSNPKSLRRTRGVDNLPHGTPSDVIYMTVVKEVV